MSDQREITRQVDDWLAQAGRDRTEGERLLIDARLEIALLRTKLARAVPRGVHDHEIRVREDVILSYRRREATAAKAGRRAG